MLDSFKASVIAAPYIAFFAYRITNLKNIFEILSNNDKEIVGNVFTRK